MVRTLTAYRAIRAGDAEAIRAEAMVFDAYGTEEGISSIMAEAATFSGSLWASSTARPLSSPRWQLVVWTG